MAQQGHTRATQQSIDRHLVLTALRTLSDKHRQVLYECYFRDSSVAEAAETLGVLPGTIKSRTHYALRALRHAIDNTEGSRDERGDRLAKVDIRGESDKIARIDRPASAACKSMHR